MDEKYLKYRARKISSTEGMSPDDAFAVAMREASEDQMAEKQARVKRYKEQSRKVTQQLKEKNSKTIYVVGRNIVKYVVLAGLPSLRKRK